MNSLIDTSYTSGAGTPSVQSESSSSTEFSSSSSPSSPEPLKMVLEVPGNRPTTPENEFDLLGPIPSFLDGAVPSIWGLHPIQPSVEELLGFHQEELLELE
ncbi:hypothetical protein O181_082982 [Austropuccinia psidii MF-1]|uniref:Uncharacterized protein n=1 Tax=Austropuccinia psidii MF-1 TaxID=1389203 RepID=A0A9Q3IJQ0_9BASI|nr:hypothetical protein [Austropuccinia psidii MF-1]